MGLNKYFNLVLPFPAPYRRLPQPFTYSLRFLQLQHIPDLFAIPRVSVFLKTHSCICTEHVFLKTDNIQ